MSDKALTIARDRMDARIQDLIECLSIPSISTRSEHDADVQRCAEWLAHYLQDCGIQNAAAEPTDGHPIVTGEHIVNPKLPTVLVYGHYDVQPPEPLDLWTSPPFEPEIRNDTVYARGAVDDKGQLFMILAAVRAWMESGSPFPVNLRLFIEGEEESGSKSLEPFLSANADRFGADTVLVCDTTMHDPETPALTVSLRGMTYLEFTLRGAGRDMHSGAYGGAVNNVLHVLAHIIDSLHDKDNRVAVRGFYDGVKAPTDAERKQVGSIPFDPIRWSETAGGILPHTEHGFTVAEATALRPCVDVNGVWGGYQGDGAKTVIPAQAGAKLSARLVRGQTPEVIYEKLRAHVERMTPEGIELTISPLGYGYPVSTPTDSPAIRAASRALRATFGRDPVLLRGGGSIPAVSSFQKIVGADATMLGFGLKSDNIHSPDEHFGLDRFRNGVESLVRFFGEYGKGA